MISPPTSFFETPQSPGRRVITEEAPARIVESGLIRLGLFRSPVRQMNLLDSRLLQGKGPVWPMPPLLVEWVGAGMAHRDWYFGVIIVDAKLFALSVFYGFNRQTGAYFSHDRLAPRSRVTVANSAFSGNTSIRARGFSAGITHRLDEGYHKVKLDIRGAGKKLPVQGELIWREDLKKTQPLVLLSPVAGNGFIYNHRAQMPIEGTLRVGKQDVAFNPGRDIANLDEVKVHGSSLKLSYRWFNFGGFDRQGRLVGVDLAHSPQKPDAFWEENCVWVGDKLVMLGHVRFEMNRRDLMQPWRALDDEGRVDITFFPEGGKTINLGPLGSYYQKCGRFRGTITDDTGEVHQINDYYGCAESTDVLS